ncbi:hypothetical protein FZEAL_6217 [Fusarium zealandicum]|uniref:Uncharacterized protein n=1 Tax=Fusarium zealandicum TaxID=1053134 RepID=A0A8H4UI77_9HYPO|nr:hypothetical protein FZEAL_6217 [Fusarium zealandicum]
MLSTGQCMSHSGRLELRCGLFHPCGERLGWVGQAAIVLAEFADTEAFATVGARAKKAFFSSVDQSKAAAQRSCLMRRLLNDGYRSLFDARTVPISTTVYWTSNIEQAFRALQGGKVTGKLVIAPGANAVVKATPRRASADTLRADATYILIGDKGCLGYSIAKSAKVIPELHDVLEHAKACGANILVKANDRPDMTGKANANSKQSDGHLLTYVGNIRRLQGKGNWYDFVKRAVSVLRTTCGESASFTIQASYRLARAHFERAEYDEAIALLRKCVAFPGDVPWYKADLGRYCWKLGRVLQASGRSGSETRDLLERSVAIRRDLVPDGHRQDIELADSDWDKLIYIFSRSPSIRQLFSTASSILQTWIWHNQQRRRLREEAVDLAQTLQWLDPTQRTQIQTTMKAAPAHSRTISPGPRPKDVNFAVLHELPASSNAKRQGRGIAQCGTVVRNFTLYDLKHFAIEQKLTIKLLQFQNHWTPPRRAEAVSSGCQDEMERLSNESIIREAQRGKEQAEAVAKVTFIAAIFVPLSFTTSIFGMNLK